MPLYAFRAQRKGYEVSVMKEMMKLLGRPPGRCVRRSADLNAAELDELQALMATWKDWL